MDVFGTLSSVLTISLSPLLSCQEIGTLSLVALFLHICIFFICRQTMAAEPPEVDLASKQDGQVVLSISPWFAAFLRADLR
jgi:fucose 4-O-acetylase-like acetyltransferase